jgi:hypothetical protein
MTKTKVYAAILGLAMAFAPAAFAQQGNMQGMQMQGHDMGSMDMDAMMKQCAQMRQQMKPGARVTADMQRMKGQCDKMDREMGSSSDNAPPATRNR